MKATIVPEVNQRYLAQGFWRQTFLVDHLDEAVKRCPDKVAIVHGERRVTYRELGSMAERLALSLLEMGFGKDDIVGVQLPNCPEGTVLDLALAKIGVIYMPILYLLRGRDVKYILQFSEAAGIVVPTTFKGFDYPAMIGEMSSDLPKLRCVFTVGDGGPPGTVSLGELVNSPIEAKYPRDHLKQFRPAGDDVAWLAFTSGTEADPKGALRTHYMMDYGPRIGVKASLGFRADADDTVLIIPPLTSQFGVSGMAVSIQQRGKAVLIDVFDPETVLQTIERERITHIMVAPAHIIALLRHPNFSDFDFSSLRVILYAGAVCPTEIILEAKERFAARVVTCYASTEAVIVTNTSEDDPPEVTATTVGKPADGISIKVVDENGDPVAIGQEGEVETRGPGVLGGYYKKPELNERAFDAEGWFRMGDLGMLDENGNLTITGRKKDIIIRGGQNISAREVEDLLYAHPKVMHAALVAMPDLKLGEKACAYVVPRPGETITLEEIVEFLSFKDIAKFKLPERLEVIDKLPITAVGKVQKFVLRDDITQKLRAEGKIV